MAYGKIRIKNEPNKKKKIMNEGNGKLDIMPNIHINPMDEKG